MLRKRLIGVVTIRNGWAIQSFGYRRYLPLGKPECLVENLDRWGVDEIFIQEIDRSHRELGPNIELISKIADQGLSTPLLYAGGISNEAEAVSIIRAGAERICLDALLHSNPKEVLNIANRLGAQAIIASIPLSLDENGNCHWFNYQSGQNSDFSTALISLIDDGAISEALVIDKNNDGTPEGFNFKLLSVFADKKIPLIAFGGLSTAKQLEHALLNPRVSAVAVGNFLNYREHAVQKFKTSLATTPIRPPFYKTRNLV